MNQSVKLNLFLFLFLVTTTVCSANDVEYETVTSWAELIVNSEKLKAYDLNNFKDVSSKVPKYLKQGTLINGSILKYKGREGLWVHLSSYYFENKRFNIYNLNLIVNLKSFIEEKDGIYLYEGPTILDYNIKRGDTIYGLANPYDTIIIEPKVIRGNEILSTYKFYIHKKFLKFLSSDFSIDNREKEVLFTRDETILFFRQEFLISLVIFITVIGIILGLSLQDTITIKDSHIIINGIQKLNISFLKCNVKSYIKQTTPYSTFHKVGNIIYHNTINHYYSTLIYKSESGEKYTINRRYHYDFDINAGDRIFCLSIRRSDKKLLPCVYNYLPTQDEYINPHKNYQNQLVYRALNVRGIFYSFIGLFLALILSFVVTYSRWYNQIAELDLSNLSLLKDNNFLDSVTVLTPFLIVFCYFLSRIIRVLKIRNKFSKLIDSYFLEKIQNGTNL